MHIHSHAYIQYSHVCRINMSYKTITKGEVISHYINELLLNCSSDFYYIVCLVGGGGKYSGALEVIPILGYI